MADFDWIFENNSIKLPELSVYKGRLKSKKQPAQPVFFTEPLTPTAAVLSPRGRELERGQQAARLVFGQLGVGKGCRNSENALSPALPHGEGAGCGRFKRSRSSEKECPKHQQQEFFR